MADVEHMAHSVTVGERGRLVIPAGLRRSLGISPGDRLVVHSDEDGRLVLEDRRVVIRRPYGSWGTMQAGR